MLSTIFGTSVRYTEAASADKESPPADPLIERAKLYIHQNGYGDISMLKLAAELGISPVQLSRRFRRAWE